MKALITGASSGIGREMAYYLASLGYDLILVARRESRLKEIKKELNTSVEIIEMDLAIEANLFKLYDLVKEQDIDMLINNAGFGLFGTFDKTDLKRELEMIDVNIKAYHVLTKLFLIDFIKKDKGIILNVASSAGFLAGPGLSTYYATKNYVTKLSMAIYEELRRMNSNVSISILCPGPVETEFNKVAKGVFATKALSAEYVAKYAINKTLKRKLIIIPTLKMKVALWLNRLVPWKISMYFVYNIQKKKQKGRDS